MPVQSPGEGCATRNSFAPIKNYSVIRVGALRRRTRASPAPPLGGTSRVVDVGLPDSLPAYRVLHGLSGTSPERQWRKIVVNRAYTALEVLTGTPRFGLENRRPNGLVGLSPTGSAWPSRSLAWGVFFSSPRGGFGAGTERGVLGARRDPLLTGLHRPLTLSRSGNLPLSFLSLTRLQPDGWLHATTLRDHVHGHGRLHGPHAGGRGQGRDVAGSSPDRARRGHRSAPG